ncbi:MAG: L-serine ammonia-lyase, iron-sulfur-dependent, subunit alpha [Firmicutes bacterium HGW-Firmicutes-11]|jgi:L-serine dehydratase|nr:MAG: L-serine ammonia-lyase, iron-sulfur-dependent, subunit alpha [Firmicutes bacterium HGW-Firmicutes-11]
MNYLTVIELVEIAETTGRRISDIVLEDQALALERSKEDVYNEMRASYLVMAEAAEKGLHSLERSASGLTGGAANKMRQAVETKSVFAGEFLGRVLARALAVAEVNACMGRIVAAPTAGSCGILPATLLTLKEEKNLTEEQVVMSLFTAAGIGMVIAKRASISGAEGGCQAECGSASAMAASAMVELMGGTPAMAAQACAIAIKNTLGLVCDPVAGLVEVPCIKRNAGGAANAIVAAELALAGIESTIPVDEVIVAMKSIGDTMPSSLKETALGGLAATPTAKGITKTLYKL